MTRLPTARRTLAALAVTSLLSMGVAACGSDSGGTDATAEDPAAGAALLSSLDEGDEVDPDEFVDTVADGVEASTTAHVEMKVSMGEQLTTDATGDLDYTTTPPSMQMEMEIPGAGTTDMVFVDGILYMKMGETSGGKYWKLDPADEDGMLSGMGLDKMMGQSDPLAALKAMKPGIDSVTFEGNEDVEGRDLDHYELTIDMATVMKSYGAGLPSEAASAMPETVTYDLWLDDEDRFAQMTMDYPIMEQQMSMEMSLDDWGKDVTIEAPSADEVTEMPDLGGMMSPSAGAGA